MKVKITNKILAELNYNELELVKKLLCKNHRYEDASTIRAYQKHCKMVENI